MIKIKKSHLEVLIQISQEIPKENNDWFESVYNKWIGYLSEQKVEHKEIPVNKPVISSQSKYPKDRDTSKDESIPISQRMFTHPEGHLIGYTRAKMLGLV